MNRSPRIIVLHCPAGGGHQAAATAIAEQARLQGVEAEVVDALSFTPGWFAHGYVQTHLQSTKRAPWAYGLGYRRLNRRHPVTDRMRRRFDRTVGRRLERFVRQRDPDLVIATHFFPLSVLGAARLRGRLDTRLVGVVTDYAAHAFWAEPGVDAYCTAHGGAALDLQRHGVPASHIRETGIPVRPAFGDVAPIEPRALAQSRQLRVLLTCGGFGVGPLESAIHSFAGLPQLRLTVVCGRGEQRVAAARRAARKAGVQARVIGFEKNMPRRLAEAHVVLGKAGGLTTSESLACGRPMALIGTCPGQEQHNEDWLCLNGAAVAVPPDMAGPRIAWLHQSRQLPAMAAAAQALGASDAAARVLEVALPVCPDEVAQAA